MNDHLAHDIVFGQATCGENCLAGGIGIRRLLGEAFHAAVGMVENPKPAPAPGRGAPEKRRGTRNTQSGAIAREDGSQGALYQELASKPGSRYTGWPGTGTRFCSRRMEMSLW